MESTAPQQSACRAYTGPAKPSAPQGQGDRKGQGGAEERLREDRGAPQTADPPADPGQLTCSLCRPCTTLRTLRRVCRSPGAGSGDGSRKMLGRGGRRAKVHAGAGKALYTLRAGARSRGLNRHKDRARDTGSLQLPGCVPHSPCSFLPAPQHASR